MPPPKDPTKYEDWCKNKLRGEKHPFFGKHHKESSIKKMSESQKKRYENPELGEKISERQKKRFEDPDERKRSSEIHKKIQGTPEERQKNRERQIGLQAGEKHPSWGKKRSEESLKRMSESQKKRYEDPVNAERLLKLQKRTFEKHPEMGEKISAAWVKLLNDPIKSKETRKRMCISSRKRWENQIERQKYSKMRKEIFENSIEQRIKDKEIKLMTRGHGFWYGDVEYSNMQDTCVVWKDVNPRVHAFFNYKCVECGIPENGTSHIGHHVFYERQACCMVSEDGEFYTDLNADNHPVKDYFIGKNPNYFVILCRSCHGRTNGKFETRKKWADHFRGIIDEQYDGKCYYTKEEWDEIIEEQKRMVENTVFYPRISNA